MGFERLPPSQPTGRLFRSGRLSKTNSAVKILFLSTRKSPPFKHCELLEIQPRIHHHKVRCRIDSPQHSLFQSMGGRRVRPAYDLQSVFRSPRAKAAFLLQNSPPSMSNIKTTRLMAKNNSPMSCATCGSWTSRGGGRQRQGLCGDNDIGQAPAIGSTPDWNGLGYFH